MWRAAVLCAALLVVALAAPSPRIAIVRATAVAWDDEPITVQVRVEPMAANRAWVLQAIDGDVVVRQSLTPLDGADARATYWVTWRLSAGEMVLRAVLCEATCDPPAGVAIRQVTILSRRAE